MNQRTVWLLLLPFAVGCGVIRNTPKHTLADGYYYSSTPGAGRTRVYVEHTDERIQIYRETDRTSGQLVAVGDIKLDGTPADSLLQARNFRQTSFDVDFLTIPFKYRPRQGTMPRQFNTNLNGGVYLGYRTDLYKLRYHRSPLGRYEQQLVHLGFSGGGFMGLGATSMSPFVTRQQIDYEYDGVIWTKGIAGIVALNKVTAGLVLGWDHLLDRNRNHWIYHGKPWIGLAFGLNLN